jgi:S-adenosylmethionine synthetase
MVYAMVNESITTSESVGIGHPDKLADIISDTILDYCMFHDKNSRVAVETLVTTNYVLVAGEITSKAKLTDKTKGKDFNILIDLIRRVIKDVGYDKEEYGFCYNTCQIDIRIHEQSSDIAQGVDTGGAGDQGMMYGYATNESDDYMPLPIHYAHRIMHKLWELRSYDYLPYLRPDCKCQVSIKYPEQTVDTVVISTQHDEDVTNNQIKDELIANCLNPLSIHPDKLYINPTGKFVIGGPHGDTGLTGRKIIVDTYGGIGRHGGGAFSGKDPSKVDRSGAYMARYIAKNVVVASLADKCEVQLAYAIGVVKPVSVFVETFGTGKVLDKTIELAVQQEFDLTPNGIIKQLELKEINHYAEICKFGHMGEAYSYGIGTWEKLDVVEKLRRYL